MILTGIYYNLTSWIVLFCIICIASIKSNNSYRKLIKILYKCQPKSVSATKSNTLINWGWNTRSVRIWMHPKWNMVGIYIYDLLWLTKKPQVSEFADLSRNISPKKCLSNIKSFYFFGKKLSKHMSRTELSLTIHKEGQ